MLRPQYAVMWAAFFNFIAFLVFGLHVANTIGTGIIDASVVDATVIFAALSNALALVTRQEESLIGAVTFLVLPLTFLSTALVSEDLMPGWMQTVAAFNPVDWAIEAGRSATAANPDWGWWPPTRRCWRRCSPCARRSRPARSAPTSGAFSPPRRWTRAGRRRASIPAIRAA